MCVREIVTVENERLVRLLVLTADFGVKIKDDADFQAAREVQSWYSKAVCTKPTSKFCVNLLTYILLYTISLVCVVFCVSRGTQQVGQSFSPPL